jgi:hypothetical protein
LNAGICRDVVPLMMATAGVLHPHRPLHNFGADLEAGIATPSQDNFLWPQLGSAVPTMVLLVVAVALAWPSALPGCFEDSRTSRQLGHQVCLVTGGCAALTHEWCAERCRQSGFTVAGVCELARYTLDGWDLSSLRDTSRHRRFLWLMCACPARTAAAGFLLLRTCDGGGGVCASQIALVSCASTAV